MTYSLDLRERVVNFVRNGGSVDQVPERYQVSRATTYRWLKRKDLRPTVVKHRRRKIDHTVLASHVRDYPEARLKDRALVLGVHPSAVGRALNRLKVTRKKTAAIPTT